VREKETDRKREELSIDTKYVIRKREKISIDTKYEREIERE